MANHELVLPSERSFGLFFAGAFGVLAVWMWYTGRGLIAAACIAIAIGFVATALAAPRLLSVANRLWFKLGILLNTVVSPIVLGAMFFLVVTPVALVMRALGRDALSRGFEPKAESYWVDRQPPGPKPESFNRQF